MSTINIYLGATGSAGDSSETFAKSLGCPKILWDLKSASWRDDFNPQDQDDTEAERRCAFRNFVKE